MTTEKRYLVYFWATENGQFIKIGHCQGNLYKRREGLQNGCPLPLCKCPAGVIVCEDYENMLKVEKASQDRFKAYRTIREWFRLTDEISTYIQDFTDTESGKCFVEEGRGRKNKRERERTKDPELRKHQRERNRERENKRNRERYQKDHEYRERRNKRRRERYQNDPEYRESVNKRNQQRRNDPEYREGVNKRRRERRSREKRKNQSIRGQQLSLIGDD